MARFVRIPSSCRILCNLVSNALKWSPEGETIRILESSDCRFITIKVSDRGPGIPEERRQTILQGGQIGLETGSEKGSTFWFSLKEISPEAAELLLQDGKPTDPAP